MKCQCFILRARQKKLRNDIVTWATRETTACSRVKIACNELNWQQSYTNRYTQSCNTTIMTSVPKLVVKLWKWIKRYLHRLITHEQAHGGEHTKMCFAGWRHLLYCEFAQLWIHWKYIHAKLHNVTHASSCNKIGSASPSINMEIGSTCIKRTSVPERYKQEKMTTDRDRNDSSWVRVGGWFSSGVTYKYKKRQGNERAMSKVHGSDQIRRCRWVHPYYGYHV